MPVFIQEAFYELAVISKTFQSHFDCVNQSNTSTVVQKNTWKPEEHWQVTEKIHRETCKR